MNTNQFVGNDINEPQLFDNTSAQLTSRKRSLLIQAQGLGEKIQSVFISSPNPSQAILVVGSGRSGTTWLANLLTAQSNVQIIFEPENPTWTKEIRPLTGWGPSLNVRSFYLKYDAQIPEWYEFWQSVLSGRIRSYLTDHIRTSYFPRRYLVKMIRANLMLGYIYDNFQPKVVFTIRHPCAVILSRMALNWVADVQDILNQEELVENHLRPWIGLIEKERDQLGAQAVWWAVENMIALKSLENIPHAMIAFESLCLDPHSVAYRLRSELGITVRSNLDKAILSPSQTANRSVSYNSTLERLSKWKSKIDDSSQKKIIEWACRMGIDMYNNTFLPTNSLLTY